jgi:hypothetical protein
MSYLRIDSKELKLKYNILMLIFLRPDKPINIFRLPVYYEIRTFRGLSYYHQELNFPLIIWIFRNL